jgi:hypothetical protein
MKFLLALLIAAPSWGQSGADVLLQSTGTQLDQSAAAVLPDNAQFKLTDPFLQTAFLEWRSAGQLPFEVNRWFTQVLTQDFAGAAHQWTAIQSHLPANLLPVANHVWAYLAWRLDLPQTFLGAWTNARTAGASERVTFAMSQTLGNGAGAWVAKQRPQIDATLAEELLALPAPVGLELELAAWAGRHRADHAARLLNLLPMGHPLSLDLASTAVLAYARKGEVGEAGKLLKRRVEPELNKRGDARELSRHYLTLGRLLFQAGALEAAEAFYARVPRGLPEFIPARAERTWGLLRLNRVGELRGELQSLSQANLRDRFLPEVSLVRAISNLKLCRYDDVATDFKGFVDSQSVWASTIRRALENPAQAKLDVPDRRIAELEGALIARNSEDAALARLGEASINATLPAVGVQSHWKSAQSTLAAARESQSAALVREKMRFWKNREAVLTEAIRKMKFVRVEAMSQVRLANSQVPEGTPVAPKTGTDATSDTVARIQSASKKGAQTYMFDGVYWPDEQFNLHARAVTRCGGVSK